MKGQSNPEISRSPRNSFRASPGLRSAAVGLWTAEGASQPAGAGQTTNTADYEIAGSQSVRAKPRAREGNSPDRPLRPQSLRSVAKDVRLPRQPGRWLRSSHAFKECVTAHWPSGGAPTMLGAQAQRRSGGSQEGHSSLFAAVGEPSEGGEACGVTPRGPLGSENAGMSSDRGVRNPPAECPRVPGEGLSPQGQSGAKVRPQGVAEAQRVEIPVPSARGKDRRGDGEGQPGGVLDVPVKARRAHRMETSGAT